MIKTSLNGLNILVVDDEESVREMERRMLEEAGCRVIEASDGETAIRLLENDAPIDLVVSDVEMPGLLGYEMARRIRTMRPHLKVLFVTGHAERLFDDQPLLSAGHAFLDKPFSARGLLEAVSLLLFGTTKIDPHR